MLVNTPGSINHLVPQLTEFVELMSGKLMVNLHKNTIRDEDIPGMLDRLAGEVQEFRDQLAQDSRDPNVLEELADASNFCFLLYQHLRSRGVQNTTERFIDEYYHIDKYAGRVYCKKTRAGSKLKPGDEVKGTRRNGRVYLRAQHAVSGATISLPRSHLIWWQAHRRWPTGKLTSLMGIVGNKDRLFDGTTVDAIQHLREAESRATGKLPFVSQYKPRGREASPNYGRWVYQRRHAFQLIRCGYFDTAEQAATLGLIEWKERTRARP